MNLKIKDNESLIDYVNEFNSIISRLILVNIGLTNKV